jgi:ATP-dependent Clp protease ATP-binding subunit ClpA
MIFMTSNQGAGEMSDISSPGLGFASTQSPNLDVRSERLSKRILRAGLSAARRKFTPEFINRLDKIVVFRTLGEEELRSILDLELSYVQQRVFNGTPFLFQLSSAAKAFLLHEGTDAKYGARHLKRAIERSLVYPMANLIATEQVQAGDLIEVDCDAGAAKMTFERIDEDLPVYAMFKAAGLDLPGSPGANGASLLLHKPAVARSRGIHPRQ